MNLPRLAVHRPITTLMGLVSIVVIGGIALARLPLVFLPKVDIPFIGIRIPYHHSNPWQIERDITKPVEEVLSTLSGIKHLRATSTADGAEVNLEFDWGQELDLVRMQVSEKLEQVKPALPAGIGEIQIMSFNSTDIPVVQGRIAAEGVDLSSNYPLLEARVANRIRRVPGVARVDLDGVAPAEIFIDLILDRVKEHGVDVGALIDKLQGASSNLVLGSVRDGELRYTARALGAFDSVQAIRDLPVDGRGLRLADIATIRYEEPPIAYGRHLDRQPAVALNVFKESTANTVETATEVMRVINEDINRDPLLSGINLFIWQDQAKEITRGINGLKQSGLIGGLMAVLILYFFLRRLDSTLIVSFSIPFSVVAACGVLYFMGKTLNILSMMGLMVGIGMLIDNAIVVLESIDRRHRDEPDTKKAALEGAGAVSLAVVSSTATTVIVFLPLILGAKTELTTWLEEVGISISIALVCSLLSSLTLIPLMSAHLLRRRVEPPHRALRWLEERYVRGLAWTLRHRLATFLIGLAGLGIGVLPLFTGMVDMSQFAATVNKRLFLRYEFADFSYKSDSERVVNVIEGHLDAHRERFGIGSLYSFFTDNEAGTVITLARDDIGDTEVRDLRKEIRASLPEIPGARVFFHEDADEGGSSTYFQVKFFGQDSGVLAGLAREAERRLETVEGIEDVSTGLNRGQREVQVNIDRERALRLGLTPADVSDIFAFSLGGMRLSRFNTGAREVDTWLALRLEDRKNLEDLKAIRISDRENRPIVLGDIATFEVVRKPESITREDRKVRVAVSATYEGKNWKEARASIEGMMNALSLPPGYAWSWDDRILEQGEENQQMMVNLLLAFLLVYIVMASLFESLSQPLAILFSIPFALPGVAWTLAITRTPLNLMSWIGLLLLIGVVVNNGIVLLDHLNQLRRAGLPRDEAILAAGRDRMRAILMTASTTLVGLLPLAIGRTGVGGLYYYPMARTIIGGLLSSTFLTLLILPYINLGVEGMARWFGSLWRSSSPTPARAAIPTTGGAVGGMAPGLSSLAKASDRP